MEILKILNPKRISFASRIIFKKDNHQQLRRIQERIINISSLSLAEKAKQAKKLLEYIQQQNLLETKDLFILLRTPSNILFSILRKTVEKELEEKVAPIKLEKQALEEENKRLVRIYQNSKSEKEKNEILSKLTKLNSRLIKFMIKKYFGNTAFKEEDLIQAANLALLLVIKKYDETKGSFSSYASLIIKQEIKNSFAEKNSIIRIPPKFQQLYFQYKKIRNELFQELNREATKEEIAKELIKRKIAKEQKREAIEEDIKEALPKMLEKIHIFETLLERPLLSLDTPISSGGKERRIEDTLPDTSIKEDFFSKDSIINVYCLLKSLKNSNHIDVLIWYFGLITKEKTLEETSPLLERRDKTSDELLTRERVRQIRNQALKNLKSLKLQINESNNIKKYEKDKRDLLIEIEKIKAKEDPLEAFKSLLKKATPLNLFLLKKSEEFKDLYLELKGKIGNEQIQSLEGSLSKELQKSLSICRELFDPILTI